MHHAAIVDVTDHTAYVGGAVGFRGVDGGQCLASGDGAAVAYSACDATHMLLDALIGVPRLDVSRGHQNVLHQTVVDAVASNHAEETHVGETFAVHGETVDLVPLAVKGAFEIAVVFVTNG